MTEACYFFRFISLFATPVLKQTKSQPASPLHLAQEGEIMHLQGAFPNPYGESGSPPNPSPRHISLPLQQRLRLPPPSLRALLPSHAEHSASAMRLWSQPRSSTSTDSLKRSEQIRPLSPAPIPQRGGHGVKFKEAESAFVKRADYTPQVPLFSPCRLGEGVLTQAKCTPVFCTPFPRLH